MFIVDMRLLWLCLHISCSSQTPIDSPEKWSDFAPIVKNYLVLKMTSDFSDTGQFSPTQQRRLYSICYENFSQKSSCLNVHLCTVLYSDWYVFAAATRPGQRRDGDLGSCDTTWAVAARRPGQRRHDDLGSGGTTTWAAVTTTWAAVEAGSTSP